MMENTYESEEQHSEQSDAAESTSDLTMEERVERREEYIIDQDVLAIGVAS